MRRNRRSCEAPAASARPIASQLGHNPKSLVPTDAIYLEVALVRRAHKVRLELLGKYYERGVSEIHRKVVVATHQRATTGREPGWYAPRYSRNAILTTSEGRRCMRSAVLAFRVE